MYQVQHVMTREVISVSPEATIDEAVSLLLDFKVSGLPVIDEQQRLLGIISEIDIIDLVYETDIEISKVRDHMTRDVRTLDCTASLDDAANIFCTQAIRRIPITQGGRVVGVVSRRDLIRFVRDIRRQTRGSGSHSLANNPAFVGK
jgi:CBS domain-containing protein